MLNYLLEQGEEEEGALHGELIRRFIIILQDIPFQTS